MFPAVVHPDLVRELLGGGLVAAEDVGDDFAEGSCFCCCCCAGGGEFAGGGHFFVNIPLTCLFSSFFGEWLWCCGFKVLWWF